MREAKLKVILSEEEISARVAELGRVISRDYSGKELVLISVLRGSAYFAVDLSRRLTIPFAIDFIGITRYGVQDERPGVVRVIKELDVNIAGKEVLIVEDILDTGLSLNYLLRNLQTRGPSGIKVCTFLNVEARRIVAVPVDYVGFNLPDIFVVGYGLDYHEQYRNLMYIAELDPK